jgi:hypothetical protein
MQDSIAMWTSKSAAAIRVRTAPLVQMALTHIHALASLDTLVTTAKMTSMNAQVEFVTTTHCVLMA